MSRPSHIRVFVQFKEHAVFAGEDIECTITFKNVHSTTAIVRRDAAAKENNARLRTPNPSDPVKAAQGTVRPTLPRSISAISQATAKASEPPAAPIQRQDSSLSIVESEGKGEASVLPGGGFHIADSAPDRTHKRSVSIISLANMAQQQMPGKRHSRSGSQQFIPPALGRTRSNGQISPLPLSGASTPPAITSPLNEPSSPHTPKRTRSGSRTVYSTPQTPRSSPILERNSQMPSTPITPARGTPLTAVSEKSNDSPTTSAFPVFHNGTNGQVEVVPPLSKVLPMRNNDETPRSSIDFDLNSNNSNETLASEYPTQQSGRLLNLSHFTRNSSQLGRSSPPQPSIETLMMGYVQVAGSFILDGSLVNQAPFEEVKRKAVVGGQAGGGVVGITTTQSNNGLFGSLGWATIGESLGDFLGTGQPSSIREMKGIADSQGIPLLSTPKSILFVDLRLAPGESKSFSYSFRMPRGLPPTHKGRAIKVSYNVIIGTQRPASAKSQQIKQVEVPFRVFSGVNNLGESLGHDLMSPYIILRDQARFSTLGPGPTTPSPPQPSERRSSSAPDFQSYVNHLLAQPHKDSSFGLLSPTAEPESPFSPTLTHEQMPYIPMQAPVTARLLIDNAMRASTIPNSAVYSPTTFKIARSSTLIATLMISRPAIKIGDLLTCVLDFSSARFPCYALEATLESSEKVDPTLAIRSPQSVERATRRVWGRCVESCVWARRVSVAFQVPVGATPGFGTTGVGLEWCVRVEIVVGKASDAVVSECTREDGEPDIEGEEKRKAKYTASPFSVDDQLLEVVSKDDRGTTLAARQRLPCESFEVTIPLRVFGAAVGDGENGTVPEGLVV